MSAALAAAKNIYNIEYDELIRRDKAVRHVFIGAVEFKFRSTAEWQLNNIYPDNTLSDGSKVSRPGIKAASRMPVREFKAISPGVISTEVSHQPTNLVVMLTCRPDLESAPGAVTATSKFYPILNKELGVYESRSHGDIKSAPIDDERYPDGTRVWFNCDEKLTKICRSSFVIVPGVLVQYLYPAEQRADWKRIKDFVVSTLNASTYACHKPYVPKNWTLQ